MPLKMAASDRAGEMRLSFAPGNWGGGHLLPVSEQNPEAVAVGASRLHDLPEISSLHIDLMKIDVEGHELSVLKGAAGVLARCRPVVLFEQQPGDISDASSATIDWLRAHGYDRFYEVRSFPSLPRNWTFTGRKWINALMRLFLGESKRVVPIVQFKNCFLVHCGNSMTTC